MEKQTASCEVLPEKKISFNGHVEGFRPQSEGLEILLKPIARRNNWPRPDNNMERHGSVSKMIPDLSS